MKSKQTLTTFSLLAFAVGLAIAEPDLIVSEITSATTFGAVDGKIAYSFGTTICNIGNSEAAWINGTNENPLISQTLYRLVDGQIQQIGIGFAHYTTPPLSSNACGLGCTPAGFNALGAGCSTTSSSIIHGVQGILAPRTEVDPFTGNYPYPFTSIGQSGDAIYKRLQVNIADISDPNALYFVETQVISIAETTPATRANNVSYRQVVFSPASSTASVVGPTYTEQPAIFAWRDHGNGIGMPDAGVLIVEATIPMDGIIHVGSKATEVDNGNWRYDYAIHNQNSSRGMSSISHFTGYTGDTHSHTFHDVAYHDDVDGLIDGTDWMNELIACGTGVIWSVDTLAPSNLLNRIRWGTTYNFSLISRDEPKKRLEYGLWYTFQASTDPKGNPVYFDFIDAISPPGGGGEFCCGPADLNGDDSLDFFDITLFLCGYSGGNDYNGDGVTNFFDVSQFLSDFNEGCP